MPVTTVRSTQVAPGNADQPLAKPERARQAPARMESPYAAKRAGASPATAERAGLTAWRSAGTARLRVRWCGIPKPVRVLSCGSARRPGAPSPAAEGGSSPPELIARVGVSGVVDVDVAAGGRGDGG